MFQNVANPVGGILSMSGKYQNGWNAYNVDPTESSAPQSRQALANYLVTLLKSRAPDSNGDTSYAGVRTGNNYAVQVSISPTSLYSDCSIKLDRFII